MKTNTGLVEYAKAQVGRPYWYGTYGQTASQSLYNSKKAQYPKYYTASDFASQYGQRVHDCVGLIKGYIWSDGPDSTPKYNSSQDKNATGMYKAAAVKGPISQLPQKAGMLVYKGTPSKMSHVGVYDGDGYVYEAKGHAYGVVKTAFDASDWQYYSQCPYTEDDSATAGQAQPEDNTNAGGNTSYDKESEVRHAKTSELQRILNEWYNSGLDVDGIWGPKTAAACNSNLLKYKSPMIRTTYVTYIQQLLGVAGFGTDVDGAYGPDTKAKVIEFQRSASLSVDGIVGKNTTKALIDKFVEIYKHL